MLCFTLLNLSVLLLFSCNKLIINCVYNDKHKDCTHTIKEPLLFCLFVIAGMNPALAGLIPFNKSQ